MVKREVLAVLNVSVLRTFQTVIWPQIFQIPTRPSISL